MPSCAVPGCKHYNRITKGTQIRYFSFPKDENVSKKWIIACCRADVINVKHACVCSAHFEPNSFAELSLRHRLLNYTPKNFRNLKPEAVPTLNLPGQRKSNDTSAGSTRLRKKMKIENTSPIPIYFDVAKNTTNTLDASDQPGTSYSLVKITDDKYLQETASMSSTASLVKYYKCPICPYMTILNFRFKRHMMTQCLFKQELFNCANSIESLKCLQCTNFETCKLVDLRQHHKIEHAPSPSIAEENTELQLVDHGNDCSCEKSPKSVNDFVKMDHTYARKYNYTRPKIKNAASTFQNLLPEKSRARYEKEYSSFSTWCKEKSLPNIGTENVLLAYFSEVGKNKKSSTLWARYSMLRSTLNIKHNMDISKHNKLIAYLKKLNVGYKPKTSSVFTNKDIDTFLKVAPLKYLPQKVALIIGISGGCRNEELFKIRISDVQFLENIIIVEIPDTKKENPRAFIINNPTWISIIKQYVDLRNNTENERFFLQLRYGKITRQPFGHNTIAKFPKKIATFLKLQNAESYTGHCFRRTAATLLINRGGNVLQLRHKGGRKSGATAESYVVSSIDSQTKPANMVSTNDIYQPGPSSAFSTQEFPMTR